ncbi:hypothetical protein ACLOJK_027946 [Asimina triloba]
MVADYVRYPSQVTLRKHCLCCVPKPPCTSRADGSDYVASEVTAEPRPQSGLIPQSRDSLQSLLFLKKHEAQDDLEGRNDQELEKKNTPFPAMAATAATATNSSSSSAVRPLAQGRSSPSPRPRTSLAVRSSTGASVPPILTDFQSKCATPLPVLRHVAEAMADDMRAGLASDGGSNLKMILSYVDSLPTGTCDFGLRVEVTDHAKGGTCSSPTATFGPLVYHFAFDMVAHLTRELLGRLATFMAVGI